MMKSVGITAVALALLAFPINAGASGGSGGGGSKQTTVKYTGIITSMVETPNGVIVTVGTSYYTIGSALITPGTSIKLDGSSAEIWDLAVGDTAAIIALWPSQEAIKVEAISGP